MSKERLELAKELLDSFKSNREIHEPFVMSFEYETIEALEYIIEQVERVQELEKKLEKERRIRKYLRNKNNLYLSAIRKAERLTDCEANVILRKALEGEE